MLSHLTGRKGSLGGGQWLRDRDLVFLTCIALVPTAVRCLRRGFLNTRYLVGI